MTQEEAIKCLVALRDKLEEIKAVKNERVNVFEASGMTTQEVKHSAFLAFLLDPKKPHGLHNAFLKKFCERLIEYSAAGKCKPNREIIGSNFSRLDAFSNDEKLDVGTERVVVDSDSRTDIIVSSAAARTVIVIENKVFTTMHDDQLNRYEKELAEHGEYKTYNKVFVYLTPNGDLPNDNEWCVFDYSSVVRIVKELLKALPRKNDSMRIRILMEDYIDLVETNILKGNKDIRKLCKEILREHRDAVEILKAYTDNAEEVMKYVKSRVQSDFSGAVTVQDNGFSKRFYSKSMLEFFTRHGEDISNGGQVKCSISFGGKDGPIVGIFGLDKRRDEKWSPAQQIIMNVTTPDKKRSEMYFTVVNEKLISEEERELPFDEIKPKLDERLAALFDKIREIENKLITL